MGLDPNQVIAKTVNGEVAISTGGFRKIIEPRKIGKEAFALLIMIDDDVFAGGEGLRVEVFDSDVVVCGLVSRVDRECNVSHRNFPWQFSLAPFLFVRFPSMVNIWVIRKSSIDCLFFSRCVNL